MKKLLLVILILVVLVAAVVFGGGYYLLSSAKQVDVEWTEADFDSYVEKSGITYDGTNATLDQMLIGDYESVGVTELDTFGSNEEITARLNKATTENSLMQDPRVKFRDDGRVEFSCTLGTNFDAIYSRYPEAREYKSYIEALAGRQIYFVQKLDIRENGKEFDATFEEFYVGAIPIPIKAANSFGSTLGSEVNQTLNVIEGFFAEEFSFDSQGIYFKGTVPQKFEGVILP